ncbi:glycosyltransferase family protein [Novosphingobium aquimarinum]|uniref:hypothetical protein n=1 Tax=Novosphingobium aquimarinum TaxID=2682494 RepID=UPI0012EC5D6C|nr:hypothetical protein [Novosphingobium aquimarinum]
MPPEINYNEGWNGYHQIRAAAGKTLYSGYSSLFYCNYPPLSFYLVGWLASVTNDVILAGRLVSLISLVALCWACSRIVIRAGGRVPDAALAVVAFLGPLLVFYDSYVGMNDPQMLGLAFASWALAVHLDGKKTLLRTALVALLLCLSLLTKHNLLSLLIVITLDTLYRADNRRRIVYVASGLVIGLAALALIWQREGIALFEQMLASRVWSAGRAAHFTAEILQRHQFTLIAATAGLLWLRDRTALLILSYLLLSLVLGAYFSGGAGTAENIFFEPFMASAIAIGLIAKEVRKLGEARAVLLPALVIGANFAWLTSAPMTLALEASQLGGGLQESAQRFEGDVDFLKSRPGPKLCESLLLCLRADQDMLVDPFNSDQAIRTGRLPKNVLTGLVERHAFSAIQLYSAHPDQHGRFANFSPDFYDAVERNYVPVRQGARGIILVPKTGGTRTADATETAAR